jgi:hypothetical protein
MGRHGARPNCRLYLGERCALFVKGTKITSNWKEHLTQQLLEGPNGVTYEERTVERRHVRQHMLETTKSGTETNVKGKADGYSETSAQPCLHRSKTHTVVQRNQRVLIMQQPVRGLDACDVMPINRR